MHGEFDFQLRTVKMAELSAVSRQSLVMAMLYVTPGHRCRISKASATGDSVETWREKDTASKASCPTHSLLCWAERRANPTFLSWDFILPLPSVCLSSCE